MSAFSTRFSAVSSPRSPDQNALAGILELRVFRGRLAGKLAEVYVSIYQNDHALEEVEFQFGGVC